MAWNIAFMFVKAERTEIENVISDVLVKTKTDIFFEDATSGRMGKAMGVSYYGKWIVISDVQGRVIFNDSYPRDISRNFLVKTFWVAEEMIFREYVNGTMIKEVKGIDNGGKYLLEHGQQPKDQWGETRIIQILESEIFPKETENGWDVLFKQRFDKYDIEE